MFASIVFLASHLVLPMLHYKARLYDERKYSEILLQRFQI